MRSFLLPLLAVSTLTFLGCSVPAAKPAFGSTARPGMTEAQVLAKLGEPVEVVEKGRVKYLGFATPEMGGMIVRKNESNLFYVRLVDGRFNAYTKGADLSFVPGPEVQVPVEPAKAAPAPAMDLRVELERINKLKADGLINEDEYQQLRKRLIEKAKQ